MSPIEPRRRQATLISQEMLTHDMARFRFQTADPAEFLPGQFAMLGFPDVQDDRAYSMANVANKAGIWDFIIKNQPDASGDAEASLFDDFPPGVQVELEAPYGEAVLETEADRDIICIGGGAGISQLISILSGAAAHADFGERKLSLLYGGRRPEDICAPLLLEKAGLSARVQCLTAVSDDATDFEWSGHRGLIHQVLDDFLCRRSSRPDAEYYFCGPTPMTDAVQAVLRDRHGVPEARLHFDSFG